jgi:hypothetical protein
VVNLRRHKPRVLRPRLGSGRAEAAVPAYDAPSTYGDLSRLIPQERADQVPWPIKYSFKLDAAKGMQRRLSELAKDLKAQHNEATGSVLEGFDKMFTVR